MSLSRFETDHNPALLPEREQGASFVRVPDLNLEELATKTKGERVNGKVLWGGIDGMLNGKLTREERRIRTSATESKIEVHYSMQTETLKDEIDTYIAVEIEDTVALIQPINPSRGVVAGFEIKNGYADTIMGNESKFPIAYSQARDRAYQALAEIH